MSERLWPSVRWRPAMRDAEERARAVMDAAPQSRPPIFDKEARSRWYLEVFGASEVELEEMQDAIARRYRRTPFWKWQRRREIMGEYIKVYGLLTAACGLTVEWR